MCYSSIYDQDKIQKVPTENSKFNLSLTDRLTNKAMATVKKGPTEEAAQGMLEELKSQLNHP